MRTNFSPRSSRAFTSAGVISNSSIDLAFQIGGRRFSLRSFIVSWPVIAIVAEFATGQLLALKLRRPLVEKRANPLAAVFRLETTNLFANFIVESLREFLCLTGKKSLLYRANRQRWTLSDLLRKGFHRSFELRGRNDLIDNAKRERRLGINHVTGIEKFSGFRRPHQLRQEIRPPIIWIYPDLCKILAEGPFCRRNT